MAPARASYLAGGGAHHPDFLHQGHYLLYLPAQCIDLVRTYCPAHLAASTQQLCNRKPATMNGGFFLFKTFAAHQGLPRPNGPTKNDRISSRPTNKITGPKNNLNGTRAFPRPATDGPIEGM